MSITRKAMMSSIKAVMNEDDARTRAGLLRRKLAAAIRQFEVEFLADNGNDDEAEPNVSEAIWRTSGDLQRGIKSADQARGATKPLESKSTR
jgi:hypothetical protein